MKKVCVPQPGAFQRRMLVGMLSVGFLFGQATAAHASATPTPIVPHRSGSDLIRDSEYVPLSRASARIRTGAYVQALPLLLQTTEQSPLNVLGLFHLGGAYLELAKQTQDAEKRSLLLNQAQQTFERVLDINHEFILPYFKLGKIALMQNDVAAAKRYYEQGLAVEPRNATLVFNLARVCDQNGERAEAIRYYRRTLALDDRFVFAYNNLALLYEEEQRYADAEKSYKTALEKDPRYNLARLNLGNLYAATKQYEAAQRLFSEARVREPENTWVYYYQGNLYMRLSQYAQAIQAYNRAIELDATNATAYYLLAVSLSRLQRMDEALQASLHYMMLEPDGRYAKEMQSLILTMRLSVRTGDAHPAPVKPALTTP